MRRLNKRGMDDKLAFTMWEMMVILMVIIALTVSVRGIANNTTYWKKYHSTDLAMMTELIIASQNNFAVNYEMKEMRENSATKMLRIDQLIFQTFLKTNSFFVYHESIDDDRFPQSYIFAEDKDINIVTSNTTSDFVVIYKEGDTVGMREEFMNPIIGCPSADTSGNLDEKRISVIELSTATRPYSTYINNALITIATGTDDELLIALIDDNTRPTTIYYDPFTQVKSEKMSCLTRKNLLQIYQDITVQQKSYDNSFEIEPFISQRASYMYWILISINTRDVNRQNLSNSIELAVEEYYR
ncbi:MAG: hypothetical protein ACP5NW_02575 [Candidatus Woesearchaeota archaeon]